MIDQKMQGAEELPVWLSAAPALPLPVLHQTVGAVHQGPHPSQGPAAQAGQRGGGQRADESETDSVLTCGGCGTELAGLLGLQVTSAVITVLLCSVLMSSLGSWSKTWKHVLAMSDTLYNMSSLEATPCCVSVSARIMYIDCTERRQRDTTPRQCDRNWRVIMFRQLSSHRYISVVSCQKAIVTRLL